MSKGNSVPVRSVFTVFGALFALMAMVLVSQIILGTGEPLGEEELETIVREVNSACLTGQTSNIGISLPQDQRIEVSGENELILQEEQDSGVWERIDSNTADSNCEVVVDGGNIVENPSRAVNLGENQIELQ